MKIVKNKCFGGFSLSPKAISEFYKKKGKTAYFFEIDFLSKKYTQIKEEQAVKSNNVFFFVYTVPNPEDYGLNDLGKDGTYKEANERARSITIDIDDRADPDLISVIEELGSEANGRCADLEIVDIPDGIEYEIDEYDGREVIREKHRSW